MSFPVSTVISTLLTPVIENKNKRNKLLQIKSIRVSCNADTAYNVWLYLLDPLNPLEPIKISYDELDSGDYFVDTTEHLLPVGFAILAQTNIPGKVFIIINAEELEK